MARTFPLRDADGHTVMMVETDYTSEDLFQAFLAETQDILPGDQIDVESPRRWLLIAREVGVPDAENSGNRWSLDHLFLDQDGIPTLVEVKRSTDTRLRRDVVGQMLDYAANAVVYWPAATIQEEFEARCDEEGLDAESVLAEFVQSSEPLNEFWERVATNLLAGRVRMLFVADRIPPELQRIIEFLNGQMNPAEVLGVEIKRYTGEGYQCFIPAVVGKTAEAQAAKSSEQRLKKEWDEGSFFQELESKRGKADALVARRILDWANSRGLRIWWGAGKITGSFYPMYDYAGENHYTIGVWTYGKIEFQFQTIKDQAPFGAASPRLELLDRLNAIPGVSIPPDGIERRPSIYLSLFSEKANLDKLLATLGWYLDEVTAYYC